MVVEQDYRSYEYAVSENIKVSGGTLISKITDITFLLAFLGFIVPEIRFSLSGTTYEEGYPRVCELLGLLNMFMAFMEVMGTGRRLRFSALHFVLLCYLLVAYIFGEAIFTSGIGMPGVFRSGSLIPIAMFISLSQLDYNTGRVKRIFTFFILAQICVAATIYAQKMGLIVGFTLWANTSGTQRLFGFGMNVTQTTFGLVVAFVLTLGMTWGRGSKKAVIGWLLVLPYYIGAILLTMTRTAPVAIVLAVIVMLHGQRHRFVKAIIIGLVLCILGFVAIQILDTDLSRLSQVEIKQSRIVPWIDAIKIGFNKPFGTGTGSYQDTRINGGVITTAHAQNDILSAFATQGFLALMLLTCVYVLLIKLVTSVRKQTMVEPEKMYRCFAGTLIVWLMFGITEICFTTYLFNGPLFIIMAICHGYLNSQDSYLPVSSDVNETGESCEY